VKEACIKERIWIILIDYHHKHPYHFADLVVDERLPSDADSKKLFPRITCDGFHSYVYDVPHTLWIFSFHHPCVVVEVMSAFELTS